MSNTLVLKNALCVSDNRTIEGDLAIDGQRITQVGGIASGTKEIDCEGMWVLPGMIDDQVHFREPGLEHKATIASESRAAVAGGITSFMEMPNSIPQTIDAEALRDKHVRARNSSHGNYSFYLGATHDNIEEIKNVDRQLACGIKVFMGSSTGNMLVDDPEVLDQIFASSPLLIATHCEDTPTIEANERAAREKYGDDVPAEEHPLIRSVEACYKSSSFAVELAKQHGTRLHVLHLTTAKEMSLFEPGEIAEKHITAEVCAHHLFFNDSYYAAKGSLIKCNPAIKSRSDQLALREALLADKIDVIATDHAPHTLEEKTTPFMAAPAGIPLVQYALLSILEHVKLGYMSIEFAVRKCSHAPAELFGVIDRGHLQEGHYADIVVIDQSNPIEVDVAPIYAKCGWSPFAGQTFSNRVKHTLVNGELKYSEGEFPSDAKGLPLSFDR